MSVGFCAGLPRISIPPGWNAVKKHTPVIMNNRMATDNPTPGFFTLEIRHPCDYGSSGQERR
jgi:hypothetical protein